MHPVHLFGRDGTTTVLPLAWIDPATAAWADHAIVRTTKARGTSSSARRCRARAGRTACTAASARYTSADGSDGTGPATTIQLGYFPDQQVGVVGSVFFGWRDNAVDATLFESRYTLELQGYPVVAGPLHLGLYGGGGVAYRFEDGIAERQRRLARADRRRDVPARHQHPARADRAARASTQARTSERMQRSDCCSALRVVLERAY